MCRAEAAAPMPAASCTQLQEHNPCPRGQGSSGEPPAPFHSSFSPWFSSPLCFIWLSFTLDPWVLIISFPDFILERASLRNHAGQVSHCPQVPHVHLPLFPARCSPISFLTHCHQHLRCWGQAGAQHIALSLLHTPKRHPEFVPDTKTAQIWAGKGSAAPGGLQWLRRAVADAPSWKEGRQSKEGDS